MRPDTKTPPKTAKKTAPSAGAIQNTKQNAKTDMKQVFADGAKALIFDRNVTKLTVKDLAAQCHVTRQTFYYHFEDIPHLLRWIMDSDSEKLISQCMNQENREEGLRHFIVTLLNLKPYVKYDMSAAQRLEVERIMEDCFLRFFERAVDEMGLYQNYNRKDQELILRYHSRAVMGLLRSWTPEDAADLDHMVHMLHLLLTGDIAVS